MIIPVVGTGSLKAYADEQENLVNECRPKVCPECLCERAFWIHGSYLRTAHDGGERFTIKVYRFKCSWCGIPVSCVPACLTPYAQFAPSVISQAIEDLADKDVQYAQESAELTAIDSTEPPEPSSSQVFRWVAAVARKSPQLLFQLQKEFVMRGRSDDLLQPNCMACPAAKRARSATKAHLLNQMSEFVSLCRSLTGKIDAVLETHAFFLSSVESLQAIFCGRKLALPTTHSMQSVHLS